MTNQDKTFFLSTAIDYVNAFPHLGHALEKIQADVIARHHRILGDDVLFLTGTDENSLKNVQAAEKEGISIEKLVDRNAKKFHELKGVLHLSFDDFIRTTEIRHIQGAQKLWQACQKDIYKKTYKGLYCVGCEAFYKKEELIDDRCPEHKTKPDLVEEENYFFRLTNYQDSLRELIKHDEIKIIPESRKNETLSFINSGLEDICISRTAKRAKGWGIDVPGDPNQKMWVWFDALANYITALGYGENEEKFQKFWHKNERKLHVIGKGILRFHAVYWPAILLSANLRLPDTIFVHGYITVGGQKMSKSLGNVIDPFELVERYGTDPVRYFLLREISPTEDGDFTQEKFKERYNADLSKGLGNLVARIITLAEKIKPASQPPNPKVQEIVEKKEKAYQEALTGFQFNKALISIWDLIGFCDKYIEKEKPWEESDKQGVIIQDLLFALSNIAKMLKPFLPETSEKMIERLKNKEGKPLFPRLNS